MAFRFSTGCFNGILGGNNLQTQFNDGVIYLYTGSQPASPDDAVTGTLIATVTQDAGAWTAGSPTNGLSLANPVGATISKTVSENWAFDTLAAGTIGWGRFVGNATDAGGSSTTLSRMDFSVGITSGDCRMPKVAFTAAGERGGISAFNIPLTNRY